MRLLNERTQVKDAITSFRRKWGDGSYTYDPRGRKVGAELAALNPETATADEVAEIIGNPSWARPKKCGECGCETWRIVEIGETPDYESHTAYLCRECLLKGADLAGSEVAR
jgi:hypothetical protein